MEYDVVIIGGGPAGLATALYTSRNGMKTAIVESGLLGGQLNNTEDIENYLGFKKISGMELAMQMAESAQQFGVDIIPERAVKRLGASQHGLNQMSLGSGAIIKSKFTVIATGTSPRMIGLEGEKDMWGRGVVTCTTCDGPFYQGKDVVVVGGGDSAFESALYLSSIAKKVTLLHRSNTYRAKPYLQELVAKADNIDMQPRTQVTGLIGQAQLKGIEVQVEGRPPQTLSADGLFVNIGSAPNTDFLGAKLLDIEGYVITNNHTYETTQKNYFAIGDVRAGATKQVGSAVGEGTSLGANLYNLMLERYQTGGESYE